MPEQSAYPILPGLDSTSYITGYYTNSTTGLLQTVRIPASFAYGSKWTTGSGVPTSNGLGPGDMYMDVTTGDVYSWNSTTNVWTFILNLINGQLTIGIWCSAPPASGQIIYSLAAPWAAVLPANMSGSYAEADVLSTGTAVFNVTQNGTVIGTITFTPASHIGTFATTGGVQVVISREDIVNVVAPATADPTLASIRISIVGTSASNAGPGAMLQFALLKASNLSDLANAATARTNLGLGTAATLNASGILQPANNLSDVTNAATARTNLGLGTAALLNTSGVLQPSNNLSDVSTVATARTNLGLGTMATQNANAVAITGGTITGVTGLTSSGQLLNVQVFATPGTYTYTPTSGTNSVIVVVQAGGGGGGGVPNNVSTNSAYAGSGGGAGGVVIARFTSNFSGKNVTVGAAGAGGVGGAAGSQGGASGFGSGTPQVSVTGGWGGTSQGPATGTLVTFMGGLGGTPTIAAGTGMTVLYSSVGAAGEPLFIASNNALGSSGANSLLGGGGNGGYLYATSNAFAGQPGQNGSGGSGAYSLNTGSSSTQKNGGGGGAGAVIIYEYS